MSTAEKITKAEVLQKTSAAGDLIKLIRSGLAPPYYKERLELHQHYSEVLARTGSRMQAREETAEKYKLSSHWVYAVVKDLNKLV